MQSARSSEKLSVISTLMTQTLLILMCLSLDLLMAVCLPWDMMGASVRCGSHPRMGDMYPRIGYGRPSGHNGGPAGPLAVQFACFDASSGIQQRIGELNHSGGGEEGEGRINYLWISAVYSNCHTTHVYKPGSVIQFEPCTVYYVYCIVKVYSGTVAV